MTSGTFEMEVRHECEDIAFGLQGFLAARCAGAIKGLTGLS